MREPLSVYKSLYVLCNVASATPHSLAIVVVLGLVVAAGNWVTIYRIAAAIEIGLLPSHGEFSLQASNAIGCHRRSDAVGSCSGKLQASAHTQNRIIQLYEMH